MQCFEGEQHYFEYDAIQLYSILCRTAEEMEKH